MGKRTAQKDAIKDITSDSQVNSYNPYRWSPASLTINIYFYRFLYLYITRITINNGTPHLKSLKSQNRRAALGRPAIENQLPTSENEPQILACAFKCQSLGVPVLGKLPVPGRPTIWMIVGQGHIALAVGAGGGCLDIFTLLYLFSPLSPSLWETARYRLKYCLKGPLNPKQPTNQPILGVPKQKFCGQAEPILEQKSTCICVSEKLKQSTNFDV